MTARAARDAFVDRLLLEMERHNYNQKDIARICNVAQQTVSDWINKKKFPRMEAIEILAEHFNLPVAAFYEEKNKESIIISDDGLRSIINIFNALNSDNRSKLIELGNLFLDAQNKIEEKK